MYIKTDETVLEQGRVNDWVKLEISEQVVFVKEIAPLDTFTGVIPFKGYLSKIIKERRQYQYSDFHCLKSQIHNYEIAVLAAQHIGYEKGDSTFEGVSFQFHEDITDGNDYYLLYVFKHSNNGATFLAKFTPARKYYAYKKPYSQEILE